MSKLELYQTLEDFQKYINENNILKPKHFSRINDSLYHKMIHLNLHKKVVYPQKREVYKKNNWDNINTISEFQNFINENNIQSSSEFRTKYNTLYQKACRLKIKDNLKFSITHYWRKLDNYTTLEDFQKYIDDNEILSPMDFKKIDGALYKKASKLNFCNQLIYEKRNISISEITLLKYFELNNIKYIFQKKYKWLKDKTQLALDFYLPHYNIAIEVQGKQHFKPNDYFGGQTRFEYDIQRDQLKYNLCKQNNIQLIYFVDLTTDNYSDVDLTNYLDKIFTNTTELFEYISKTANARKGGK